MRDLKKRASQIFLKTLEQIDVGSMMGRTLGLTCSILRFGNRQLDLDQYDEIILAGIGKASMKMCATVEGMLGDRVKKGVVVTDRRSKVQVKSEVIVGGHPLPTEGSLAGARRLIELVKSASKHSLIIFLISGGGSALAELPRFPNVTLEELREVNRVLVTCGATISEINTIRKHLSAIKGGRLGSLANGAKVVAFFVSDVNTDDWMSIASNPVVPETLRPGDFLDVVEKYGLIDRLPASVAGAMASGLITGNAGRDNAPTVEDLLLISDNSLALNAAAAVARELGFRTALYEDLAEGRYQDISAELFRRLSDERQRWPGDHLCVISGGEVSCPVSGKGIGGRNQEFVLYSAATLAQSGINQPTVVFSCGTDGIDGNSMAAGAVADERTVAEALARGVNAWDYLERNDSHSFFTKAGGIVLTGPTGNNVRDIRILLSSPNTM